MSLSSPVTGCDEDNVELSPTSQQIHEKRKQANDYATLHIPIDPSQHEEGEGEEGIDIEVSQNGDKEKEDIASLREIRSDFLQKEIHRKSIRLTSGLLTCTRPSGLNLIALGTSPSMDIFVRLGNGIRRILLDLYNIIEGLRTQIIELRTKEVKLFFKWWEILDSYISTSLDVYSILLLPWASQYNLSNLPDIKSVRKIFRETVKCFDGIESHISRRAPDETIARIIKGLTQMGESISNFLQSVENYVPDGLDDGGVKEKEIMKMEKKVVRFLHRRGVAMYRRLHLLILERGMSLEEAAAWKSMTVPLDLRITIWTMTTRLESKYLVVVQALSESASNS